MQRDFLEPGGFGASLGNDVSLLAAAIAPCAALLAGARRYGMLVVHTREGHRPDLSDAPRAKVERGAPNTKSDLLVINKIDLAPMVGASLEVMDRDAKKMRGERPFVFTNLKTGHNLDTVVRFIETDGMLCTKQ